MLTHVDVQQPILCRSMWEEHVWMFGGGGSKRIAYCTDATRGLSALAEFLVRVKF